MQTEKPKPKTKKAFLEKLKPKEWNETEFVPIRGFKGFYEINCKGVVRSVARYVGHSKGRKAWRTAKIKAYGSAYDYLTIILSKKGINKTFYVHKLVALHFVPNPEGLTFAIPIDENKRNLYYKNLKWSNNISMSKTSNRCRAVKCTKTGEKWPSICSCADAIGLKRVTLTSYLNGFNKNKSTIVYND